MIWRSRILVFLMLLAASANLALAQDRYAEAARALQSGEYEEAIDRYSKLLRRDKNSSRAARGLMTALTYVGRYDDALKTAARFSRVAPASPEVENRRGVALLLQGELDDAAAAFARAIALGASDSLTARVNLAVLRYDQGEREAAMAEFDRYIDIYNRRSDLTAAELVAVGRAVRYLGVKDPQLFKDALRVFDEAIAAEPTNPEPRIQVGELFLEKYNSADAKEAFEEVLELSPQHPAALLGTARRAHFDRSPGAMDLARESLDVNPNFVPARVFLATLYMEAENYSQAAVEAKRALKVNPASLEALAALAAAGFLQRDWSGYREARARALALNPRFAGLDIMLAEASARNRLYEEAAEFAAEAVRLDPEAWRGHALLGVNLLRLGEMDRGREALQVAFEGDPFDIWTKNTLDLLDTFVLYEETRSPRFLFFIDREESALLTSYFEKLAEEAYERMAAQYGYQPTTPIRVEVFRTHADFSVRTIGLAGLGALGVSFGPVISMDSPGAREVGHFNWGSTLWHELAHTFHLGMTDHRVPRWFSEGLAVFEERRARPGWGADATPGFLIAYLEERTLPLSELNDGFVRPTYPQQIIHSYYQASLVSEYIAERAGFEALVAMLEGYREGLSTEEVVQRVLDLSVEELNEAFLEYFEARFAVPLAALEPAAQAGEGGVPALAELEQRVVRNEGDFMAQLNLGRTLFEQGSLELAEKHLRRAKELFPEYAGSGSPYGYLARIHSRRAEPRRAAAELDALTSINGRDYDAQLELAAILESIDELEGAAASLERAIYIYPFEMSVHERLAAMATRIQKPELAIRERRAILALGPADQAEAHYQLALAYSAAGDERRARRAVLQALERAPNFEAAQDLLLELRAGGS